MMSARSIRKGNITTVRLRERDVGGVYGEWESGRKQRANPLFLELVVWRLLLSPPCNNVGRKDVRRWLFLACDKLTRLGGHRSVVSTLSRLEDLSAFARLVYPKAQRRFLFLLFVDFSLLVCQF